MSKKSRLSHDQKRKQKLAKRERRQPEPPAQAAPADRYRSPEFIKPLYETELGIYESYVVSGRKLTDAEVERDLKLLISRLRVMPVAELLYPTAAGVNEGPTNWAGVGIAYRWRDLFDRDVLPARDDLVGLLQTILGSLDVWRSRQADSRGYLNHLEGFMNKLGVRAQLVDPDGEPVDELYEIGELWLAGSPEARRRFTELAHEIISAGDPERVVNACQRLLGRLNSVNRPEFTILSELSIRAQNSPIRSARGMSARG